MIQIFSIDHLEALGYEAINDCANQTINKTLKLKQVYLDTNSLTVCCRQETYVTKNVRRGYYFHFAQVKPLEGGGKEIFTASNILYDLEELCTRFEGFAKTSDGNSFNALKSDQLYYGGFEKGRADAMLSFISAVRATMEEYGNDDE